MTQINPSLPIVNQPNSTEEPKIPVALGQIVGAVNNIDSSQIVDGAIQTADIANLAVTTGKLADNGVTAAKIEAQQAWQTVALVNGGTCSPANLSYYKDSLGIVHIRPERFTHSAQWTIGVTIATLPTGYRPGVLSTIGFLNDDGSLNPAQAGLLEITTAGVIRFASNFGLAAAMALSFPAPIHFRAEN
jgi:hypothetical protein